jgi:aspartate racemase
MAELPRLVAAKPNAPVDTQTTAGGDAVAPGSPSDMRRLGLIGGMSWESTQTYYRLINESTRQRRGGLHSAPLLLESVDFAAIAAMQKAGDWQAAGELLAACARRLEAAGAEALVLCTNTMHKLAPQIEAAVSIPLLHIVDATAAAIKQAGLRDIALLGTAFTMEQPFYAERMGERHGLRIHAPDAEDRAEVHRIIYEELCLGEIRETSRRRYREVIARLVDRGAQGLILGCTEIGLLISQADSAVPVFDSTALHAQAAVGWALNPGSGLR